MLYNVLFSIVSFTVLAHNIDKYMRKQHSFVKCALYLKQTDLVFISALMLISFGALCKLFVVLKPHFCFYKMELIMVSISGGCDN